MARRSASETAEDGTVEPLQMHPALQAELRALEQTTGADIDKVQKALAARVQSLRGDAQDTAAKRVAKKLERL